MKKLFNLMDSNDFIFAGIVAILLFVVFFIIPEVFKILFEDEKLKGGEKE